MGHAVGLAKLRLDGFASMEGYEPEDTLTTHPLFFQGDRLVVNARSPEKPFGSPSAPKSPYGQLRVELLDKQGQPLEGYSASDCDAFSGDEVHHPVTWKGQHGLGDLAGTPVRLRFYLKNAALYSFQIHRDRYQAKHDESSGAGQPRPSLDQTATLRRSEPTTG